MKDILILFVELWEGAVCSQKEIKMWFRSMQFRRKKKDLRAERLFIHWKELSVGRVLFQAFINLVEKTLGLSLLKNCGKWIDFK